MKSYVSVTAFVAAALATVTANAQTAPDSDSARYSTLASSIASPLFTESKEFANGYSDAAVMLRMEVARQQLRSMSAESSKLSDVRTRILLHLEDCYRSMEEIRRLDANTPDIEGIAKKALDASPALFRSDPNDPEQKALTPRDQRAVDDLVAKGIEELVKAGYNAWQASTERANYRGHYRSARRAGLKLEKIAASTGSTTRPVIYGVGISGTFSDNSIIVAGVSSAGPAEQAGIRQGDEIIAINGTSVNTMSDKRRGFLGLRGRQGSATNVTIRRGSEPREFELNRALLLPEISLLWVDLDGSWDSTFNADNLYMRNDSGADLTNCTLAVHIEGTHGEQHTPNEDHHLHYVRRWPSGARLIAHYTAAGVSGIASDESVDFVKRVRIELYSDQYRNTVYYDYAGDSTSELDADVKRYFESNMPRFFLRYIEDDFLFNAGVRLTHYDGLSSFPDPTVTVKVREGSSERTARFGSNNGKWSSGALSAQFLRNELFNGMHPDTADITFEFPGTSYKYSTTWDVRRQY